MYKVSDVKHNVVTLAYFFMVCAVLVLPSFVAAQGQIIPACGNAGQSECGFVHLIELIDNIINYLIKIAIPVSAAVFAYAGFILMTTAIADKKSEAKKMIEKVFIGLVIVLAAWLVTNTLMNALVNTNAVPDLIGN